MVDALLASDGFVAQASRWHADLLWPNLDQFLIRLGGLRLTRGGSNPEVNIDLLDARTAEATCPATGNGNLTAVSCCTPSNPTHPVVLHDAQRRLQPRRPGVRGEGPAPRRGVHLRPGDRRPRAPRRQRQHGLRRRPRVPAAARTRERHDVAPRRRREALLPLAAFARAPLLLRPGRRPAPLRRPRALPQLLPAPRRHRARRRLHLGGLPGEGAPDGRDGRARPPPRHLPRRLRRGGQPLRQRRQRQPQRRRPADPPRGLPHGASVLVPGPLGEDLRLRGPGAHQQRVHQRALLPRRPRRRLLRLRPERGVLRADAGLPEHPRPRPRSAAFERRSTRSP